MGSFGGVYITETRVAYDITKSMVLSKLHDSDK